MKFDWKVKARVVGYRMESSFNVFQWNFSRTAAGDILITREDQTRLMVQAASNRNMVLPVLKFV